MSDQQELLDLIRQRIDPQTFREHHWEGSFSAYIERVCQNPAIARNAFQRIYDMILFFGTER